MGSACDGDLYAVWVTNQTPSSYVLNVGIQVTSNYLANHGGPGSLTDSIDGLAVIPDNQASFTAANLMSHPTGTWTLQSGGLNASGCNGSDSGFICANGAPGAHLFSGSNPQLLVWQFLITGVPPAIGETAHIKYHYIDVGGNKVGDLGSFDVAIQCIGGNCVDPASTVPEPVTSTLIGSGLVGLYFMRRRFPR